MFALNAYPETFGLPSHWAERSRASLVLLAVLGTLTLLFVLWSLYLLVRFAVAFGRASRLLRRKWLAADRSVVVAVP